MAKATLEVKLIFFLIYDVLASLDKQQISAVDELSILLTHIHRSKSPYLYYRAKF